MAPQNYLDRLKSYYTGHKVGNGPVLSTSASVLLSILFTLLYVLPFYLSPKTRPSPTLNRDAPSVIKARIHTVTSTVVASTVTTLFILLVVGGLPLPTTLHHLGIYPLDPVSIVKSLLLTAFLYAAPLYESLYIDGNLSPLSEVPADLQLSLKSWQGYRNFVAGPLTEELLFRCSFIPLHLLAHVSATRVTFLTPLYFGIAHVHHFYEFHLTHPHTPLVPALLRSVFQFGYTTVFGWYASFIYIRTGNLYAVFIIHAFCNWMGLPRLWGRIRFNEDSGASSVVVRGKEDTTPITLDGKRDGSETPMLYTAVYYVLLILGAFGFYWGLFPLTSGSGELASYA